MSPPRKLAAIGANPAFSPEPFARQHAAIDRLSWDMLRLFLAVAEAGSFRSAAVIVGISINTLRSKVDRLETQMAEPLLRRSVEGVEPTQAGHELLKIARDMRDMGRTTVRVQRGRLSDSAQVKILAADSLGALWIVPQLARLQLTNPEITVDLSCTPDAPDVLFRDVDLAIYCGQPTLPGMIVERVGVVHIMPFATDAYLSRQGTPAAIADVADHHFVWHPADSICDELVPVFGAHGEGPAQIAIRTNTRAAHRAAIEAGAGIGFLPSYATLANPRLRPVDLGLCFQRDVCLIHHADMADRPAVHATHEWLRSAFDAARHPWFAETFIHPDDWQAGTVADNVVPFEIVR
jgi:DNA-binding transcriptional LysR family regulator